MSSMNFKEKYKMNYELETIKEEDLVKLTEVTFNVKEDADVVLRRFRSKGE